MKELTGYDRWKTNPENNELREPAVIEHCCLCKEDLHENEDCYFLDGKYYCTYCIDEARITLDDEEMFWVE